MTTPDGLWALAPQFAEQVLCDIQARMTSGRMSVPAGQEPRRFSLRRGVAVISITGVISRKEGWWADVGQDGIRQALDEARQDERVRGILLSFNSPGGVAAGVKELADYIASIDDKPVAAYADGLTASAAYWLASATGRVYAPATAQVGSVGVISEMCNISGYLDKIGVSITYIASGKWKTAGNPVEKLTPEQTAYFQERVDALHSVFKADVAQHMGISQDPAWTEAQILFAQSAQQLGLVTAIVRDEDQAINRLLEVTMPDNSPDAPAQAMTRDRLAAEAPELLKALLEEGRDSAGNDGVEYALNAMETVCGKEKAEAVRAFVAQAKELGLSAKQLAGLGKLMPQAPAVQQAPAEPQNSKSAILNALQEQSAQALPTSPDASAGQPKSSLVADAERRRAEAARQGGNA